MVISVEKVAPRVIALAAVAYCVWPSLTALMSEPESKRPQKLPELAASLLSPKMPPQPTRDPFGFKVAAAPAKSSTAGAGAAKNAPAKQAIAAKPPERPVDPLKGLTLEATSIVGNRRMAVINGRSYTAQETLRTPDPTSPRLKIVNVLPYKVLLEREGKPLELTYSDLVSHSATPPNTDGNAKPASVPTASGPTQPDSTPTGVQSSGNNRTSSTTPPNADGNAKPASVPTASGAKQPDGTPTGAQSSGNNRTTNTGK
jgi:hypothetical protein